MKEQEVIKFWKHRFEVEIPAVYERRREDAKIKRTSLCPEIIVLKTEDDVKKATIPVLDLNVLIKNDVDISKWNYYCKSGIKKYEEIRRFKKYSFEGSYGISRGTFIEGYYKINRIEILENRKKIYCYYNSEDGNEFVEQEIEMNYAPLFYDDSQGNRNENELNIGDVLHVNKLNLVENANNNNKHYVVNWEVVFLK